MGTMYLKGSIAKVNFPETSSSEMKHHNGMLLTLEMDSCAECDIFPMSYKLTDGTEVITHYNKNVIKWIDTKQSDY